MVPNRNKKHEKQPTHSMCSPQRVAYVQHAPDRKAKVLPMMQADAPIVFNPKLKLLGRNDER